MKTLSLSEAKMKLSNLIEVLNTTDEEIMITKNGSPAAVLISPGEFESMQETMMVRATPELMEEIKKGMGDLKKKKAGLYTLEELFR